MENKELKDCPFCGSPYANKPVVRTYYNSYTGRMYYVECTYCAAESKHSQSEEEAIRSWNKKVE